MNFFYFILFTFIMFSCNEKRKQVATVGEKHFFLDEVDASIEPKLFQHLMEIYEERSNAIDLMIELHILNEEAKKRGITYENFIDSLYKAEIYDTPRKDGYMIYMQDSTKNFDISYEQGNQYIFRKEKRELRKKWVDSLNRVYDVKIDLKRPEKILHMNLDDVKCYYRNGDHFPLTMWIISDFDCSVCKELYPVFESIYEKYKEKINFA